MNLNMTSIKDAWGVSDISSSNTPPGRLNKSSFLRHPNAITDPLPTRIDVALFDKDLITELFSHTPEYRTKLVTDRLTRERTITKTPTLPPPMEELTKEYFQIPQWENTDLKTILLITFALLLLDKISNIWKSS
jgi:hypothetical protein